MTDEEKHGPQGVWKDDGKESGDNVNETSSSEEAEEQEGDADEKKAWKSTSVKARRRLRRYQLQRLKYFYAIAEFDTKDSAAAVYEACDGVEYASTGIRFDLRFVSDDEEFSVSWEITLLNKMKHHLSCTYTPPFLVRYRLNGLTL